VTIKPVVDLQTASYKGVPFLVTSTTLTGGKKTATKQFINSDRQLVEELGTQVRSYTISGIITHKAAPLPDQLVAATAGQPVIAAESYQEVRDRLLAALESPAPGILIHPFFKVTIPNAICTAYTLSESTKTLNASTIEMSFSISNHDGLPSEDVSQLSEVEEDEGKATEELGGFLGEVFKVTASALGSFSDALAKVESVVDAVNAATDPAAILVDQIDDFTAELAEFTANAASLVNTPQDLSDSVVSLYETMKGLYPTARGTFDAFTRLFDFGDDDTAVVQDTFATRERQKNRDTLNGTMQGLALSNAYLAGVQVDFGTTEDVDVVSQILEDQYQKVLASDTLSSDAVESLADLRTTATDFFNAARFTRPQILEVRTELTSTRLLAYQYYGDSSLGPTLAALNNVSDTACVEGIVKVLSA
jgi:prophage DNA circulation protein